MKSEKISELTINRLSVYLRSLNELTAEGTQTVSSQSLADRFNLNSAQIRKDLAYFGEFGVRGLGYNIEELRAHLTKILGLNALHRLAIIGAGNLGTALANYEGFSPASFSVAAIFDNDREKVGRNLRAGVKVHHTSDFAKVASQLGIDIAAIAVPASAAEAVLETVAEAGIKAVLNFAPIRLQAPPGVKIKNVDLLVSLESLSYYLGRRAGAFEGAESESSGKSNGKDDGVAPEGPSDW
ncbi:MAG: redox-sensing transcriptional repressor Rex [Blastocatellia bacterium]